MGWKSKLEFNPVLVLEKGESAEGVYKGTHQPTSEKISGALHSIEVDGVVYDMYSCGSLNFQLKDVEPETRVRITYQGMREANITVNNKKIKKDVHQYVVSVWED